MALVDWSQIMDYALIGSATALGGLLLGRLRRNGTNHSQQRCYSHTDLCDSVNSLREKFDICVTEKDCDRRHSEVLDKMEEYKQDIIHRLDRLEDRINHLSETH